MSRVITIHSCDMCPHAKWLDQGDRPGWGWWMCGGGFPYGFTFEDMRAMGYDNGFTTKRPRKKFRYRMRHGQPLLRKFRLPSLVDIPGWCPLHNPECPDVDRCWKTDSVTVAERHQICIECRREGGTA